MENKIYTKKSEKVTDFLIGFLGIPLGVSLLNALIRVPMFYSYRYDYHYNNASYMIFSVFIYVMELILAIYLAIKRKYVGIGLLFALVVVPLVLAGTCFLIMFGGKGLGIF